MKRIIKFSFQGVIVASLLLIASCDGDDAIDPLVGIWVFNSETATNCDDPQDNYTDAYPCDANECTVLEFESDGTLTAILTYAGVTETISGTYTRIGRILTFCLDGDCDAMYYTITGSVLKLSTEDDFDGCLITLSFNKQ